MLVEIQLRDASVAELWVHDKLERKSAHGLMRSLVAVGRRRLCAVAAWSVAALRARARLDLPRRGGASIVHDYDEYCA